MKKKIIALGLIFIMSTALLMGCSAGGDVGKTPVSNEFIKINQFNGLEIPDIEIQEVTDEDVQNIIDNRLNMDPKQVEITDRSVENGDIVNINYEGKIDDVPFDGGTGVSDLTIGIGQFIPGFEEQIIGHKINETFDISVPFPDDYQNTDVAGKDAVFTITINRIFMEEPQELTDEWVKTVSETATNVAEFKEEVRAELILGNEETKKSTQADALWHTLIEHTDVINFPEGKVDEAKQNLIMQYEQMASYYGMDITELVEGMMGMDEAAFDQIITESAEESVKQELAIQLIAKKAKIDLTQDEFEAKWEEMAPTYGFSSVEELKEAAPEDTLKMIVLQPLVEEWLLEHAVTIDQAEYDEKHRHEDDATTEDAVPEEINTEQNLFSKRNLLIAGIVALSIVAIIIVILLIKGAKKKKAQSEGEDDTEKSEDKPAEASEDKSVEEVAEASEDKPVEDVAEASEDKPVEGEAEASENQSTEETEASKSGIIDSRGKNDDTISDTQEEVEINEEPVEHTYSDPNEGETNDAVEVSDAPDEADKVSDEGDKAE